MGGAYNAADALGEQTVVAGRLRHRPTKEIFFANQAQ